MQCRKQVQRIIILVLALGSRCCAVGPSSKMAGARRGPSNNDHQRTALDYGAVPNDGIDDTVALQWALRNCSVTGGSVFIPPGSYIVSPLSTAQGGPLPLQSVDTLPLPSNCHVRGGGREGANATTIYFATTGGTDGKGVNGVDGLSWHMFGWCGTHGCTVPPSNISISDLHLSGSTNYTNYTQIAGAREHGSLIFFYQTNPALPPIVGITVERILAEKIAGDCMDFGDGVQQLFVSDINQRDCLRVGIDQSGVGPIARDREIAEVRDLLCSPGVQCSGNSISTGVIGRVANLSNLWIHDNVLHNSMTLSGVLNLTVENNVVTGSVIVNTATGIDVHNNSITATDAVCPLGGPGQGGNFPGLLSILAAQGGVIANNSLSTSPGCRPMGVYLWSTGDGRPFVHDLTIRWNRFRGDFDTSNGHPFPTNGTIHGGIVMVYVDGVLIEGNSWRGGPRSTSAENVCSCCRYGNVTAGFPNGRCLNITITDQQHPPVPAPPPSPSPAPAPPAPCTGPNCALAFPQLLAAHQYTVNFEWLSNATNRAHVDTMPFDGITIRFKNHTQGGPQSVHSNYSVNEAELMAAMMPANLRSLKNTTANWVAINAGASAPFHNWSAVLVRGSG